MSLIEEKINSISDSQNIADIKNQRRVMPEAVQLALNKASRKGFFWFEPNKGILDFSISAKTHYDMDGFNTIKDQSKLGWIRGMVFEKDKKTYMLIYKVDFLKGTTFSGKTLKRIYREITEKYNFEINDIFCEEGYSLVAQSKCS